MRPRYEARSKTLSVLLAGETWVSWGVHIKGLSAYHSGGFGNGAVPFTDALRGSGMDVVHVPNHLAVTEFPREAAALSEFDVVVLSDIGADTLQLHPDVLEAGQRMADPIRAIVDYVAAGGGLLMIGGYMSFSGYDGRARYHNTPLAAVLPVTMLGYDDRVEEPAGVRPSVAGSHAVLEGLPSEWPHFLGYNRLVARPEAEVLLTAATDPFLVVGTYGRGRVAAFASDCSPHWGSPEFVSWPSYGRFWTQLVSWLGNSDDGSQERAA